MTTIQDRFKMRIWSEKDNKMSDVFSIDFVNGRVNDNCLLSTGDYTLMQCTGIKDMDNVLIYERDIVRYADELDNLSEIAWDVRYDALVMRYLSDGDTVSIDDLNYDYMVVGNTYKDKRLLPLYYDIKDVD